MTRRTLAFYGSSLLSSYWNGAATYYRGILSALAPLGWDITFYEPDAFDRQAHRDIDPPPYARSVVYPATPDGLAAVLARAAGADVVVKASGVGVFDDELVAGVVAHARPRRRAGVLGRGRARDARRPSSPAARLPRSAAPCRQLDMVLTYGGGPPVVDGLHARSAPAPAPRSTTPSTRRRTIPSPAATRASPPTWASSPTACPTARRGWRRSSSPPPPSLPGRRVPAGRVWAGTTSR